MPGFEFVPIAVGTGNFEVLSALGVAMANVIAKREERVLIVASSDMNHYESDAVTRVKDRRAIEHLLALEPRGLYDVVREANISMCGYGPATIMLTAANWARHTRNSSAMRPPAIFPAIKTWSWATQALRFRDLQRTLCNQPVSYRPSLRREYNPDDRTLEGPHS